MDGYNIRFAQESDIPQIMRFIDENWRKNHILARDRRLFEWQYINNNKLNMVIGEDECHSLQAILGFIPYSSNNEKDFSLSLWRAKEGTAFLGIKLLMFLLKEEPHRHMFCNGINVDTSAGIYHRLRIKTGKLKQWYRLEKNARFRIAKVQKKIIPQIVMNAEIDLIPFQDFQSLKQESTSKMFDSDMIPYKSEEYIKKRYFDHPSYNYLVYGIKKNADKADAAIIFRVQECNSSKVLRIIDFLGDNNLFYYITEQIDEMMKIYEAEYVDIYETGLDDEQLLMAGWLPVGQDENIIPNYFAPYEPCNVEINICTTNENIVLFKGDGDQDRPN